MEIFYILALIYGIAISIKTCFDIKHSYARSKQIAKNMEMIRYHFWLTEVGLKETAFMFNEFGLSIECKDLTNWEY